MSDAKRCKECGRDADPANACGYEIAWVGKCKFQRPCALHAEEKCSSCGVQATRSCDETGQFVCGAPLCADCTHRTFDDGTNGGVGFNERRSPPGMKRHVRKSENTEKSWWERESVAKKEDADG